MAQIDDVLERSLVLASKAEHASQRGRELCGHSRELIERANARIARFYRSTRIPPRETLRMPNTAGHAAQPHRILKTDRVESALVVEFADHRCGVFQAERLYSLMVAEDLEASEEAKPAERPHCPSTPAETTAVSTGMLLPFSTLR